MKLRNLLAATALFGIAFGLAFLLLPAWAMGLYGITTNDAGTLAVRFFGGALSGYGLLAYLSRGTNLAEARRAEIPSFLLSFALGFVLSLIGQISAVVNPVGWAGVVIFALFALAFGYFQFGKVGGE